MAMSRSGLRHEPSDSSETETEDELDVVYWPFDAMGTPNDVLIPKGEVCQTISDLLSQVSRDDNEYSFGGAATMLPKDPGLAIKSIGNILLPLCQNDATQLETRARKVRDKVWMFLADDVEMKNVEWSRGIQTLTKFCAERLGYKEIELMPVPTMLLIYGEGGHLDKQQVIDPTGRSVARLEVQLPSCFTGGRVLINEEETGNEFSYELGKKNDVATRMPHYFVHPAGAYRTVEKLESGYRSVVVYSLCLPRGLRSGRRNTSTGKSMVRKQLADVMKTLAKRPNIVQDGSEREDEGDEAIILALLLSKSCRKNEIEAMGATALTGADCNRFDALVAANSLLRPDMQLKFHIACLHYKHGGVSNGNQVEQSVSWFSISGGKAGRMISNAVEWVKRFTFLNPDNKTLQQLWGRGHGYSVCDHERFAIIGWPISAENKISFIRKTFLTMASKKSRLQVQQNEALASCLIYKIPAIDEVDEASAFLQRCKKLATSIIKAGGLHDATLFFREYFGHLKEKRELVSLLAGIVRKFGWDAISPPFLSTISCLSFPDRMSLTLTLADEFEDSPEVRTALTAFAVEKARMLFCTFPEKLASFKDLCLLWKHVMACDSLQAPLDMESLFKSIEGKLLGPAVVALSKCIDAATSSKYRVTLQYMATRRRQWLTGEINRIEEQVTLDISDTNFPDAAAITEFLQGDNTILVIRGFRSMDDAFDRAEILRENITAPVEITSTGRGQYASVRLVKTPQREGLPQYKAEVEWIDCLLLVSGDFNAMCENVGNSNNETASRGNARTCNTSLRATGKKRPRKRGPPVVESDDSS